MTLHPHSYTCVINDSFTTHIKSHVILLHCIYTKFTSVIPIEIAFPALNSFSNSLMGRAWDRYRKKTKSQTEPGWFPELTKVVTLSPCDFVTASFWCPGPKKSSFHLDQRTLFCDVGFCNLSKCLITVRIRTCPSSPSSLLSAEMPDALVGL